MTYIRGSTATFRKTDGKLSLDIEHLAKVYSNWGQVPTRINDIRAQEISLLAQAFLGAIKHLPKKKKK